LRSAGEAQTRPHRTAIRRSLAAVTGSACR
jgi:hypothetical protein